MPPTARLRQRLRSLTADDFDDTQPAQTGRVELQSICDALKQDGTVVECADAMFDLMERLDHVDLGSPGPLVHALEATSPAYELPLNASLRRKPGPLSVWMVNRILNADLPERAEWLQELTMAAEHPRASQQTRRDTLDSLRHQTQRGRGWCPPGHAAAYAEGGWGPESRPQCEDPVTDPARPERAATLTCCGRTRPYRVGAPWAGSPRLY